MSEQIMPFHCGTQRVDWDDVNCGTCTKGYGNNGERFACDLQEQIGLSFFGDGSVSAAIAERMGHQVGAYNWRCPERVEHPESQARRDAWIARLNSARLCPLWKRLKRAAAFAYDLWVPLWRPEIDIYGVMGRIPLTLAWTVAWGIHHDDKEIPNG